MSELPTQPLVQSLARWAGPSLPDEHVAGPFNAFRGAQRGSLLLRWLRGPRGRQARIRLAVRAGRLHRGLPSQPDRHALPCHV